MSKVETEKKEETAVAVAQTLDKTDEKSDNDKENDWDALYDESGECLLNKLENVTHF
jgi:hypothetical protein